LAHVFLLSKTRLCAKANDVIKEIVEEGGAGQKFETYDLRHHTLPHLEKISHFQNNSNGQMITAGKGGRLDDCNSEP
jgi:hypothetical protein